MKTNGKMVATVNLDTTELEQQVSDLQVLIQLALEYSHNHLITSILCALPVVLDDVIIATNYSTTSSELNILYRVRLGAKYERLAASIGAGELNTNSL